MADDCGVKAGREHPGASLLQVVVERAHLSSEALRVGGREVDLERVVVPDGDQVLRHVGCSLLRYC